MSDRLALLGELVAAARRAGADAADAVLFTGASLSVQRRMGKLEHLERSEGQDVGLRAFVGRRSAIVSATSLDPARFAQLAERAVAMARAVPEDPFGGLPEPADLQPLDLDLHDGAEPDADALLARAAAAEDAALAVAGVTNSEGADAGWNRSETLLATSAGFSGRTIRTGHSVSVTALAGSGTGMERDYDYASTVHLTDLDDPVALGRKAGTWAVRRLNAIRPATATLPVVFDPRVAGSLLSHLASAINGASVARGTTFLKDSLGARIFAPGIHVHDDPHRRRGLRSRAFDAEGQPGRARAVIEDGVLTTWLMDTRSARQLGLASTGHASRGVSSQPSPAPSNLWLAPGALSPAALMADIVEGLYVTEMLGMGVNGVTGDYSRGAAGFMIRNGELVEPVSGVTVAGRLQDMFARLVPADDLRFRRGTDAPTVRIDGLTVAGA